MTEKDRRRLRRRRRRRGQSPTRLWARLAAVRRVSHRGESEEETMGAGMTARATSSGICLSHLPHPATPSTVGHGPSHSATFANGFECTASPPGLLVRLLSAIDAPTCLGGLSSPSGLLRMLIGLSNATSGNSDFKSRLSVAFSAIFAACSLASLSSSASGTIVPSVACTSFFLRRFLRFTMWRGA